MRIHPRERIVSILTGQLESELSDATEGFHFLERYTVLAALTLWLSQAQASSAEGESINLQEKFISIEAMKGSTAAITAQILMHGKLLAALSTQDPNLNEPALTPGEAMMFIGGKMASLAKYEIRWERHGNFETEGGLAPEKPDRHRGR